MMKKIAIFDYYLGGHHIEYIHHLYVGASLRIDKKFLFILPNSFATYSEKLKWEYSDNIEFVFFECNEKIIRNLGGMEKAKFLSKILNRYIRKYDIRKLILIETMPFLPFLPFLVPKDLQISSIIYNIARYRVKPTLLVRFLDNFKYTLISYFNCFKNVYLLNDKESPAFYNKKYSVNKFFYLPDPYFKVEAIDKIDFRKIHNIDLNKKILLHFGGLTKRKGTIDILDAIIFNQNQLAEKYCFIFAGRVYDDIKDVFYQKIAMIKDKVQILIFDDFCDYKFLGTLCQNSDFIIIPYHQVSQSSGIISYAAQFHIPVIGPSNGLLGNIIERYNLGILLSKITPGSIASCLLNNDLDEFKIDINSMDKYLFENSIENFVDTIYSNI